MDQQYFQIWKICDNYSYGYFSIVNLLDKTELFIQDGFGGNDIHTAYRLLPTLSKFMNWVYDNEYDTVFKEGYKLTEEDEEYIQDKKKTGSWYRWEKLYG